jgi:hypothetical protein
VARNRRTVEGAAVNATSLSDRVSAARSLLEEVPDEHDDLEAEQLVNLYEAIEFLERLETSLEDERADD